MGYSNIPTDGSGRILITDIGFSNQLDEQALVCRTNTPNPTTANYYLHPSMQTTDGNYVIQSTDPQGYRRNKDLANGLMRLKRDSSTTNWTEGVLTCIFHGVSDPPISVGVYYSSESHYNLYVLYVTISECSPCLCSKSVFIYVYCVCLYIHIYSYTHNYIIIYICI